MKLNILDALSLWGKSKGKKRYGPIVARPVVNKKVLAEHSALKGAQLYSVHLLSLKLMSTPTLWGRRKYLRDSIEMFILENPGSFVAIVGTHTAMLEKKYEKKPQITFQMPFVLRCAITLAFVIGMTILHIALFLAANPLSRPKTAARAFSGLGSLLSKSVRGFSEYRIYEL